MRRLLFVFASAALLAGCSTQQGSAGGSEGSSIDAGATGSGAAGAPADTLLNDSDASDPTSPDPGVAGAQTGVNATP